MFITGSHHKDLCQPLVGKLFLKLKGGIKPVRPFSPLSASFYVRHLCSHHVADLKID